MKRKVAQESPVESVADPAWEEDRGARRRRLFWILAALAVLGAFLYWILTLQKPSTPSASGPLFGEDSPDLVIDKFHLVSTVQGKKRWELFSTTARVHQDRKKAYADQVTAQYYKKDRIVSTLTADEAVIDTETNATEAVGHVELIVENGSKLETERLNWDPETDRIRTDQRVHIFKGSDEITAVGMTADTQLDNVRFLGDVETKVRDTKEIETFGERKGF